MKSTRSDKRISSSKAILQGLSPDGGLFVFESLPTDLFHQLDPTVDYATFAHQIHHALLDDFTDEQLSDVLQGAYQTKLFPNNPIYVKTCKDHAYLELYHGPTFAFKDMALSVLPRLFQKAKDIQQITKPTVILTATSGDTGSAALAGFGALDNTHVIVLYPTNGVSPFQEQQMNAYQSATNTVIAVDGNFDDCQRIVKDIFQEDQPTNILLSSANSINIGRIIPQIVYYFRAYFDLVKQQKIGMNQPINVVVPTGNFGNIYAAYLAVQMGLPVHKLIVASNQNNVLTECFNNRVYRINRTLHTTFSPSMDIVISSNFERYLYHQYNEQHTRVIEAMSTLQNQGEVKLKNINQDQLFYAAYASEENTIAQINNTLSTDQYLIDPHTAVARYVGEQYRKTTNDSTYQLIVSTASPFKFPQALLSAFDLDTSGTLQELLQSVEKHANTTMDTRMKQVLQAESHKTEVSIEDAYTVIRKVIGDVNDSN